MAGACLNGDRDHMVDVGVEVGEENWVDWADGAVNCPVQKGCWISNLLSLCYCFVAQVTSCVFDMVAGPFAFA